MRLIVKVTTFLLSFAIYTQSSASSPIVSHDCSKWAAFGGQECRCFTVTLDSGTQVRDVVYGWFSLSLIKTWFIAIREDTGTVISSYQEGKTALSDDEFRELIDKLLNVIKSEHDGKLDKIQLTLGVVDTLWKNTVHYLRNGGIPDKHRVEGKDLLILRAVQSSLGQEALVKYACEQVKHLGRECRETVVSMNPVPFQLPYIGKRWGEIKDSSDAGINKERSWYGISLDAREN